MMTLDMRTVFTGFVMTNIVSTLVILFLHIDNRGRYKGTIFWFLNFILQSTGVFLIALRGHIPDWISMDVSNSFSIGGTILGIIGINHFIGRKPHYLYNIILFVSFSLIQIWFTFFDPALQMRNLNIAIASSILYFQSIVIIFFLAPAGMKNIIKSTGLVYISFFLISFLRILKYFIFKEDEQDFFHKDLLESVFMVAYQMNVLFLTYSVVLMYNRRALKDISFGEEKYYKAFNTAPFALSLTRLSDGKIMEVNAGFSEITGHNTLDIKGLTTLDLHLWHDFNDRERAVSQLTNEGRVINREFLFNKKDGNVITGQYSASIISIADEPHILSSINDITERRNAEIKLSMLNNELEKRVAERTSQLEASNRELEAFSYSVSHDLRAPLRSIHGFTQILLEDYAPRLDKEAKRLCNIIFASTNRMSQLIDDLLSFSRIGRTELVVTEINMTKLAEQTILELKSDHSSPVPEFRLADLPPAYGDMATLKVVFTNIISNAIKYSSKKTAPVIEIGSSVANDQAVYWVRDNGAGFEMKYYKKLFGVFQRLHSSAEFEGNGVGLAIAERIIKRHNGQIWAESEPDKGAIFSFTVNPGYGILTQHID